MRLSEFWAAVEFEFGSAYGQVITHDLVLTTLGDQTSVDALQAGESARTVWEALCTEMDVPKQRWWAYDPDPKSKQRGR